MKILQNQKGISTFWGISIILMESVVVFFIFYILYFFWIENPTPTSNILIVRAVTRNAIQIPRNVDTSGWLEYLDEEKDFSFSYPQEYKFVQDNVFYSNYKGKLLALDEGGREIFSLKIFKARKKEGIPQAYQRLTGVNPSVYQMYKQKVGGLEAEVYRQSRGRPVRDKIYFVGNGYFFEAPFNKLTVPILATFNFKSK